ncbi:hypothetical protein E2C01_038158 [Portunus trituberculatus]|uniref:Uncharacterized protein n=1 Tax=Portunus trituberculatus TaxID=210409 RepID=A0A5B7FG29_PORTR|nr:hypothetical protein [Portunus trituberculatus]
MQSGAVRGRGGSLALCLSLGNDVAKWDADLHLFELPIHLPELVGKHLYLLKYSRKANVGTRSAVAMCP